MAQEENIQEGNNQAESQTLLDKLSEKFPKKILSDQKNQEKIINQRNIIGNMWPVTKWSKDLFTKHIKQMFFDNLNEDNKKLKEANKNQIIYVENEKDMKDIIEYITEENKKEPPLLPNNTGLSFICGSLNSLRKSQFHFRGYVFFRNKEGVKERYNLTSIDLNLKYLTKKHPGFYYFKKYLASNKKEKLSICDFTVKNNTSINFSNTSTVNILGDSFCRSSTLEVMNDIAANNYIKNTDINDSTEKVNSIYGNNVETNLVKISEYKKYLYKKNTIFGKILKIQNNENYQQNEILKNQVQQLNQEAEKLDVTKSTKYEKQYTILRLTTLATEINHRIRAINNKEQLFTVLKFTVPDINLIELSKIQTHLKQT